MSVQEQLATAQAMVGKGKGLLAADESNRTIAKRFDRVGVESTEETRRSYRELLFTTPGLGDFIGGAIMYDETIRQSTAEGRPFPQALADQGIVPGIKVDRGAKPLAGGQPGETVTEGLDGLRERFEEYYELGARFAKWRTVITIGEGMPSDACQHANAHSLARYAALAQEQGLVPVVEPEVMITGDHGIDRCYEVTEETLWRTFDELYGQGVVPERMVLKPSMVQPGEDAAPSTPDQVAEATVRCYLRVVPAAVPGITMLSGGQSDQGATENLNAMNNMGPLPWELTFSYARALQDAPLKTWLGDPSNFDVAQKKLYHRARCNSAAHEGTYTPEMETAQQ